MDESVSIGDLLAGKYRVEKILGSGAMGVVVAARHEQLDTLVALKWMAPAAASERDLVQRFLREGRAAARLRGEHVARVMDVGTLETGAPYLVMEYLEGTDLAALLAERGPLPIRAAVEYVVQACDALAEAHGVGIIHRDVKPSNLFLARRLDGSECIKVLDFGISKVDKLGRSSSAPYSTQSKVMLGSPSYMAPEQMHSARHVDARADIWALGATLYELLTGHVPFEAESLIDLACRVAQDDPVPPCALRGTIPWELEQLVLRCLAKPREERFPDALTLKASLSSFLSSASNAGREARRRRDSEDPAPPARAAVYPSLRPVTNEAPAPGSNAASGNGEDGPRTLFAGSRVAWGIAAVATICGLAAVATSRWPVGHASGTPSVAGAGITGAVAASQVRMAGPVPTAEEATVEAPIAVRPAEIVEEPNVAAPARAKAPQPAGSIREGQGATRPALAQAAAKPSPTAPVASSATARSASSPTRDGAFATAPLSVPSDTAAPGVPSRAHAGDKPRVQLERDNPWP